MKKRRPFGEIIVWAVAEPEQERPRGEDDTSAVRQPLLD